MATEIELRVKMDAYERDLRNLGTYTDREVKGMTRAMGQHWKRTEREAKAAARAMGQAWERATDRIGGRVAHLAREFQGLFGSGGMGLTAGGAGAAVGTLAAVGTAAYAATAGMSEYVDEIGLMSEGTGLATETVIAMRQALAAGGSSFEKVQGGLGEWIKRMREVEGETRSADEILRDQLKTLDAMADPTERAAARMKMFGSEVGRAMAALSSDALEKATADTAAHAENVRNAAGASADWDAQMAKVSTNISDLTVILGTNFEPVLSNIISALGGPNEPGTFIGALAEVSSYSPVLAFAFGSQKTQDSWIDWLIGLDDAAEKTRQLRQEYETLAKFGRGEGVFVGAAVSQPSMDEWRQIWTPGSDAPAGGAGVSLTGAGPKIPASARPVARRAATGAKQLTPAQRAEQAAAKVHQDLMRDIYVEGERDRGEQIAAGEAMKAANDQAETDRLAERRKGYEDLATSAVSSVSQIIGASNAGAKATAAASLIATVAYQAVAVARAFAEGGPIAGPIAAAAAVGAIGVQIAQLASVSGVGGGQSGGGGGGRGGGRRSEGKYKGPRSAPGDAVTFSMRYEHRGFGQFFDDHQRGRGGSRSRGKRAQRTYAGR